MQEVYRINMLEAYSPHDSLRTMFTTNAELFWHLEKYDGKCLSEIPFPACMIAEGFDPDDGITEVFYSEDNSISVECPYILMGESMVWID